MKKCFLLDTNVLMHDPKALFAFEDNEVIIPLIVLDELDKHKTGASQAAKHARMVIRSLDELRALGDISEGVLTERGGKIRVELNNLNNIPNDLDPGRVDNRIISVALGLKEKTPNVKMAVVTKDINLRVKCDALGVKAEDYTSDSVVEDLDSLYRGHTVIEVDDEDIDLIHDSNQISVKNTIRPLYPNEFVHLKSNTNEKHSALAKFNGAGLEKIKTFKSIWGISSRNKEQAFALDALFDQNIKLITITGTAGVGKTLIAVAAGISQMLDVKTYKRIIMTRPTQPMGKDIGFLPGPQPLDAKILTPCGWTLMNNIKAGDYVVGRNGKPTKVIGIYPKGKKEVFKISTTDGTSTECCIDHLWHTKTKEDKKRNKDGCVKTTREILDTLIDKNGKLNHYLPRNESVELKKQDLPIAPYVMGVILGDGSISNSISFSSNDIGIVNRVEAELKNTGLSVTYPKNSISYGIRDNLLSNKPARSIVITNIKSGKIKKYKSIGSALSELNIKRSTLKSRCDNKTTIEDQRYEFINDAQRWSNRIKNDLYNLGLGGTKAHTKFIPDIYKISSIGDRVALLQGIMDTDGTIKKNGEASFCTTSKRLALDVVDIVRSLGGRAGIRERDRIGYNTKIDGRVIKTNLKAYEFTISMPQHINPFYIDRKAKYHKCKYIYDAKISNIEKISTKEVQCIMVEDPEHLYITNDFIVTHNTLDEKMAPWMAPLYDNLELIFSDKGKFFIEDLRNDGKLEVEPLTYIRGRSIPQSYIIIDEAQNLTRHEVKTIITRVGEGTKVVLTGDIQQIDTPYIDSYDNGLSYTIEKFKDESIAAHVTLMRGERSELASLAAEKL